MKFVSLVCLSAIIIGTRCTDHYFPRRYPTFSQLSEDDKPDSNSTLNAPIQVGSTIFTQDEEAGAATRTVSTNASPLPTGSTIFNEARPVAPEAVNTLYKAALIQPISPKVSIEDRLPSYAHEQSGGHTGQSALDDLEPRTGGVSQPQHSSESNLVPQALNSHQSNYLPVPEALTSQEPSSSYNANQQSNDAVQTYPEHDFEQVKEEATQETSSNVRNLSLSSLNLPDLNEQQDRSLKYEYSLSNHVQPPNAIPNKSQRLFFPSFWLKYYNYPRMACMAAVGLSGTCYTKQQCRVLGGTVYGICARGYGVCCIVRRTCGAVTSLNRTYFSNPEYPGSSMNAAGSCTLVLTRPSRPRICQVRLDFHEFQLMPPVGGDCVRDRFTIAGNNPNNIIPPLCGVNSGQHMYFDIDQLRSPFALTVTTSGQGQRRWNIAVTFIDCYSRNRAPPNCLQYYEGGTGYFRSFNYLPTAPVAMTGGYLNNLNYAVCFRREMGACSQTYMTNSTMAPFDIMNVNDNNAPTLGNAEAGLGLVECPNDFIELGGLRYCGTKLNPSLSPANPDFDAPVLDDTNGPIMAKVVTNQVINGVGFQIGFTQNPCRIRYPGIQQNG